LPDGGADAAPKRSARWAEIASLAALSAELFPRKVRNGMSEINSLQHFV
jgi:hypothetical protein